MLDNTVKALIMEHVHQNGVESAQDLIRFSLLSPKDKEEALALIETKVVSCMAENGELDDFDGSL